MIGFIEIITGIHTCVENNQKLNTRKISSIKPDYRGKNTEMINI